jgi:hypothetical protein
MDRLLQDSDERRRLIRLGKKKAQEYTSSRTARETLAVYEEVLSGDSRPIASAMRKGVDC